MILRLLTGNRFVQSILMLTNTVAFAATHWQNRIPSPGILLNIFAVLCIIHFTLARYPWYNRKYRGLGIEDHFCKIAIGVNYAALLVTILYLANLAAIASSLALIFSILLSAILLIGIVLISYHIKDPDQTPPAYFAANLYLNEPSQSGLHAPAGIKK